MRGDFEPEWESFDDDDGSTCEGCGLPAYGEGRYTDDDVYLCGPCYDAVPVTPDEDGRPKFKLVKPAGGVP